MDHAAVSPFAQRRRFLIAALLFLGYAAFGVSFIAVTPLLPELGASLQASRAELGLLNSAVTIAKIIGPLVAGWLAVRLGTRRAILAGAVAIVAGALLPLATGLATAVAARFVFGFGGAVMLTLLGPMSMQWFGRDELPIVNGLNNVAANTGIALTLFATPALAAELGWRNTLLVYGAINALFALTWALLGRDGAAESPAQQATRVGLGEMMRRRDTWLVTLTFMAPLTLYLAINTWLPSHYVEAHHLGRATASHLTGLVNLIGVPAAIAGGLATRWLGLRRPFLLAAGLLTGLGGLGVILATDPALRLAAAGLLGVGFFLAAAPLFTLVMELPGITPRHAAVMLGVVFSGSYLVASLSPLLVGWLHDRLGSYTAGLVGCALFAFLPSITGALLPETGPQRRETTERRLATSP